MNLSKIPLISEDRLSLWIDLFIFIPSLSLLINIDILEWGIKVNVWRNISDSTSAVSKLYKNLPWVVPLLLNYLLLLLTVRAWCKIKQLFLSVNFCPGFC